MVFWRSVFQTPLICLLQLCVRTFELPMMLKNAVSRGFEAQPINALTVAPHICVQREPRLCAAACLICLCLHLEFNVRLVSRFHIAGVPSSVEVFVFFSHPVKRSLHCHADLCLIYIHDMQEFAGANLHKLAVSVTERGKAEDQREGEWMN